MKSAREPISSRPKPCTSLETPQKSCPFGRKKTDRAGQRPAFPSVTLRFAPWVLVHMGAAHLWRVDDRGALDHCRIWCLLTQQYMQQHACACCGTLPGFPRQCLLPLACQYLPRGTKLELGRDAPAGEHHSLQSTKPPTYLNRPAEWRRQVI